MTRPKTIHEVDTPAILIDIDRVQANLAKAQAHADSLGVKLRPHIKTHKLPMFALKQIEAGAAGITCQKLGEAEVMADAGLTDIFLPYNIIGQQKLDRLHVLHQRIALSVTVDNTTSLDGLARRFTDAGRPLKVLVECDTGMGRCGVQTPAEALELAQIINRSEGLRFGGLMTYPAAGKPDEAEEWLYDARELLAANGIKCETISSGGTPDMWRKPVRNVVTEYRPGTYIYFDRSQVARGAATLDDCALTVLTTVVSHPTADRAIIDAGSKALSTETLGLPDFGELMGRSDARVTGLSEEHGTIRGDLAGLRVGERVRVVPDHVCIVSNLFDEVNLVSGEAVIDIVPVAARGKLK
ncbi:D-TA family PLP-dependent enzyme [Ochrobactrum sp. CM-21-5]|nr:D-TA family PLP-dependent enzyme [Ochrobactrum sp. CM-21-5]MBC2885652.1 D-TA family PLP-dependent enzyme [Ochrobactrum sp. CM-21-5]